jgi:hypothetical protein
MRLPGNALRIGVTTLMAVFSGAEASAQSPPGAKATAVVCTPKEGTKPFTLLVNDKGALTSVVGGPQAIVGHNYPGVMPLERFLAIERDSETKGWAHMLRLSGPGPTPTFDIYYVLFSSNDYSEGVFILNPQRNPQRLILTSTGGKCKR